MEALATLFATRLAASLPFLDRATGMARMLTKKEMDGETPITVKLPVPISFTAAECEQNDRYLMPGAEAVGICFFEDGGTGQFVNRETPRALGMRSSAMRLLLWVNTERLDGELTEAMLLLAIERAMWIGQHQNVGEFASLYTTYTSLPAEASLFGRYSFATETPLLLPPYRVLGLDLRSQYQLTSACQMQPLPSVKDPSLC